MEHTNKIAIQILKDQYSDYPENAWHYDEQYKMIVKGIELSKEVPVAGVTDEDQENAKKQITEDFLNENNYESVEEACWFLFDKGVEWRDKLAVTGNKPLKTEGWNGIEFTIGTEMVLGRHCPYFKVNNQKFTLYGHAKKEDAEFIMNSLKGVLFEIYEKTKSSPIDTLDKELFDPQICSICKINIDAIPTVAVDKEELLKQAKDNPTPEEFLEDKYAIYREGGKFDASPQEIYKWMEEYLRLCTGGGEKE